MVKNLAIPQEPPGGGKNSSRALLTDTRRQVPSHLAGVESKFPSPGTFADSL